MSIGQKQAMAKKTLTPAQTKQRRAGAPSSSTSMGKHPAPAAQGGPVKKKSQLRRKTGAFTIMEVRRYQRSAALLIPRGPFFKLVRSTTSQFASPRTGKLRFTGDALFGLQEAAESYLVNMFETMGQSRRDRLSDEKAPNSMMK